MPSANLSSAIRDALNALTSMVRQDDPNDIDVPDLDHELMALAGEPIPAVERQISPPLVW